MLKKFVVGASALAVASTTAYLIYSSTSEPTAKAAKPALRYGGNRLGLARALKLGPTAAPRALPSRTVAASDLAYLPADSEAVIGINFAQAQQSALWKTFVAPGLATHPGVRAFEAMCGFDPLTSLGSISIGVKGLGDHDEPSGVAVIHGFEKTKAMSCFDEKGLPAVEKAGAKVIVDGEVVLFSAGTNGENAAFMFVDERTALFVIGKEAATKESVERVASGKSRLQSSSKFEDALVAVNTDSTFWLMLAGDSPTVRAINAEAKPYTPIEFGTIYMSLNVTDSIALDAGVRLGSPETVKQAVATIQKEMREDEITAVASKFFDQLDIFADGSDLIFSLAMSGDQILPFVAQMSATASASLESDSD